MRGGAASSAIVVVLLICGCGAVSQRSAAQKNAGPASLGDRAFTFPSLGPHTGSPAPGPGDAKAAHCADIGVARAGQFFRIAGTRVELPADNPMAHDRTIVQPGDVPLAHYGIGVDDGTAVCAVYMPTPPVPVGGHLSLVVQAVRATGGGLWFGWIDVGG